MRFCDESDFFGGAVLFDRSCGVVSVSASHGESIRISLDHDPELTMSGVYGDHDGYSDGDTIH